jgi:hypothetical protein
MQLLKQMKVLLQDEFFCGKWHAEAIFQQLNTKHVNMISIRSIRCLNKRINSLLNLLSGRIDNRRVADGHDKHIKNWKTYHPVYDAKIDRTGYLLQEVQKQMNSKVK